MTQDTHSGPDPHGAAVNRRCLVGGRVRRARGAAFDATGPPGDRAEVTGEGRYEERADHGRALGTAQAMPMAPSGPSGPSGPSARLSAR
ncbi:hypothetical protein ACLMNJ_29400 [Streptomyces seoulensis]